MLEHNTAKKKVKIDFGTVSEFLHQIFILENFIIIKTLQKKILSSIGQNLKKKIFFISLRGRMLHFLIPRADSKKSDANLA